jgi:hypothetical protein
LYAASFTVVALPAQGAKPAGKALRGVHDSEEAALKNSSGNLPIASTA